jgi:hypothetical protein
MKYDFGKPRTLQLQASPGFKTTLPAGIRKNIDSSNLKICDLSGSQFSTL